MDCIVHGVAKELDMTERLSLHFQIQYSLNKTLLQKTREVNP